MLFKKKPPSKYSDLSEKIITASDAVEARNKSREKDFDAAVANTVKIIDRRLREDFLCGNAQFTQSVIKIDNAVTQDQKVIDEAVKLFEKEGWRVRAKQWGSGDSSTQLTFALSSAKTDDQPVVKSSTLYSIVGLAVLVVGLIRYGMG